MIHVPGMSHIYGETYRLLFYTGEITSIHLVLVIFMGKLTGFFVLHRGDNFQAPGMRQLYGTTYRLPLHKDITFTFCISIFT